MGQLDEQKPRKESCFETAVKYTKIQKDMLMTYLTYLLDHCPSVICRKRQTMRQSLKSTPPIIGDVASCIRPEDYLTMA